MTPDDLYTLGMDESGDSAAQRTDGQRLYSDPARHGPGWRNVEIAGADAVRLLGELAVRLLGKETRGICRDPDGSDVGELVKQSDVRQVYRVRAGAGDLFLKFHLQTGWWRRILATLFGGPARAEYRTSRYAHAHAIPAVNIIACAQRRDDWKPHAALTVSIAIDGAVSLSEMFDAIARRGTDDGRRQHLDNNSRSDVANQSRERERPGLGPRSCARGSDDRRGPACGDFARLSESVARLVALAHDNAFLHPDSHPGNILVRQTDGDFSCYYADMYGARCGRTVTDSDAARNLAALGQWFLRRVTRTDRLRFLKAYAGHRNRWQSRDSFRTFVRQVDRCSASHTMRLYGKRDRRISRDGAYFTRLNLSEDRAAVVTLRYRDRAAIFESRSLVRSAENWRQSLERMLTSRIALPDQPEREESLESETIFAASWFESLLWRLTGSPVWRRYRTACCAMNRDVPAALGVAHVAWRGVMSSRREAWVMQRAPGGEPLLRYVARATGTERAQAIERVGRLLADTARSGLALRNVCAARIDVARSDNGPVPYWVGVEGTALRGAAGRHVVIWMLSQLARSVERDANVSRADRARALRACCLRLGWTNRVTDWRAVWRELPATDR